MSSDLTDDHELAEWLAETAGAELLRVRAGPLEGSQLKDAGDHVSNELLTALLAAHRPHDAVLSEEGVDDSARLRADRVWIIDPLDGTREFGERPRSDWAVHVALWERGHLSAGAVALPAVGSTFSTARPPRLAERREGPIRVAVSRTRPPAFLDALKQSADLEFVPMGSAGAKVMSVVRGVTDVYVHAGGQYEWDSAAPVAVASAAGLHTSRADGEQLFYNNADTWLPDLLVCRPEFATLVASFVANHWSQEAN